MYNLDVREGKNVICVCQYRLPSTEGFAIITMIVDMPAQIRQVAIWPILSNLHTAKSIAITQQFRVKFYADIVIPLNLSQIATCLFVDEG